MSLLLYVLSGVIVAFGQPAWAPWLAPITAICGYALFWHVACKTKKRFFLAAGWFALIQLLQLSWMTSIEFQGVYILIVYGLLAIGLGAQFGLLTTLVDRIPFVASASLWALMEWSRVYVLCGFSFNPVGLALTVNPFSLQAVTFFGIFGLSFWVILTNLVVWKRRWKSAAALALCPYVLGGIFWGIHHSKVEESQTLNVALVQTALLPSQKTHLRERPSDFISPYEQWERITQLLSKVKEPVDLVVLPEAAIPYTDEYPLYSKDVVIQILRNSFEELPRQRGRFFDDLRKRGDCRRLPPPEQIVRLDPPLKGQDCGERIVHGSSPENIDRLAQVSNRYWIHALGEILHADVIVGLDGEESDTQYSSAFFASKGEMHRYDKQILLPLAEYLPFQSLIELTKNYGITQFFTHGKQSRIFHSKVPISASICYEETFGHIMRQGKREGAALFVNVTNDNWYPNSKLPKQHFDLAKTQAVSNGTPLVRACNSGITTAIDSLGREIASLDDWNKADVLIAKVPLYQIWTLYTFWGDQGIVIISIFFLIITAFINRKSFLFGNLQ